MLKRILIALCGAVLIALVVSFAELLASGTVHLEQSDLLVYYSTGHLIATGHGGAIYDSAALRHVERSIVGHIGTVRKEATFLYPPYVALIFAPLSALPFDAAYAVWLVLSLALLVASLAVLQRYAGLRGSDAVLLWVAVLSFLPVFAAVVQGQVSTALLLLLTVCFLALRSRRDLLAGAMLALALVKPPYVIPFLLVLLLHRRWRAVAAFATVAAALLLAPLPILGMHADSQYLHVLLNASQITSHGGGWTPRSNHDFAGFAGLLLARPLSTVLQAVLSLAALAVVVLAALRTRQIDLPFALATIAALLINPHVLIHDLTLLAIPASVAVRYRQVGAAHLMAVLSLGYVVVLVGLRTTAIIPLQLSVIAMAALGAWLFVTALRLPQREERAELPSTGSHPVVPRYG